jgi:hypothetical protein
MAIEKKTAPKTQRAESKKVSASRTAVRRWTGPKVTWVKVDHIGNKGHGVEFSHAALPDAVLAFIDGHFVFCDKPSKAATVEILSYRPAKLPKTTGAQLKRAILRTLKQDGKWWLGRGDIRARVNG